MIHFGDTRVVGRFWDKAIPCPMTGCWLWIGSTTRQGYGRLSIANRTRAAHRYSFETTVGRVPDGLQLDHRCRVRCCVNPAHLEPVTARENLLRGDTFAAANARRTTCRRGHLFTKANTIVRRPSSGGTKRECRTCARESSRLLNAGERNRTPLEHLTLAWQQATAHEREQFLAVIAATRKED